jgi:hypothetical protein
MRRSRLRTKNWISRNFDAPVDGQGVQSCLEADGGRDPAGVNFNLINFYESVLAEIYGLKKSNVAIQIFYVNAF